MKYSRLAFYLYLASLTPMLIGGLAYAFINEYMPYHAIATGMEWQEISPGLQVLIIASLNANGSLMFCSAITLLILLLIPFRQGERWACFSITGMGVLTMTAGLRSALMVDLETPANPPWFVFFIVMFFLCLALFISIKHSHQN